MQFNRLPKLFVCVAFLFCGSKPSLWASDLFGDETAWAFGGHTKYQFIHTLVPDNSVLQDVSGDRLQDHNFEARLKLSARRERLDFETHAQFIAVYSDSIAGFRDLHGLINTGADVINDNRRWFNLTHELNNKNKNAGRNIEC